MNLKSSLLLAACLPLAACTPQLAKVQAPSHLSKQPEQLLTTSGKFWGLGLDGTFNLDNLYSGQYSRSAGNSSYFGNLISRAKGTMAAEVVNNSSGDSWILSCKGGGTSLNIGILSLGGDKPYTCTIQDKQKNKVGSFSIKKAGGLISAGPTGQVKGSLSFGGKTYAMKSLHKAQGSFIPIDQALGYQFSYNGRAVAVVQVNGRISLQSDGKNMDAYAIATIASGLSLRPES